jgi:hypothetical protein
VGRFWVISLQRLKLEAKSAIVDVKAAAKENTADAIKTLKTVMNNDHAPSAARVGKRRTSNPAPPSPRLRLKDVVLE